MVAFRFIEDLFPLLITVNFQSSEPKLLPFIVISICREPSPQEERTSFISFNFEITSQSSHLWLPLIRPMQSFWLGQILSKDRWEPVLFFPQYCTKILAIEFVPNHWIRWLHFTHNDHHTEITMPPNFSEIWQVN